MNDLLELIDTLEKLNTYESTHKLETYKPYPFQLKFHNAIGYNTDKPATQKTLVCGNKVGKTLCAAQEVAMHMTGLYKDYPWYQGLKFDHPIECVCGTHTIQQTRDIIQAALFGAPGVDEELGTGSIPKNCIINTQKLPGYSAFDFADVRHVPTGGRSRIYFRAYEIGAKKHMGRPVDLSWEDEEPPFEIHMQMIRGGFAKKKALRLMTFTPEFGMTDLVMSLLTEPQTGQAVIRAGWKDAPHMMENYDVKIAEVPEWQRPFRVDGEPTVGEGIVFPIADNLIKCEPIEIPYHWPRITGIDLGFAPHPFAIAWLAIDRDSGVTYVYRTFKRTKMTTAEEAATIKHNDDWIPVAWPHDAAKHDRASGRTYRDILAGDPYNVNMLPKPFSNPPNHGQREGTGGQGIEVGLTAMYNAFLEGTLKVFSTCTEFFEEKKLYHRKSDSQGRWMLVPKNDDAISAIRYGFMSQRFARIKPHKQRKRQVYKGAKGW